MSKAFVLKKNTKNTSKVAKMKFYIRFLYYNAYCSEREKWIPLPEGIKVQMYDYDPFSPDEEQGAEEETNKEPTFIQLFKLDEAKPDLYLKLKTDNKFIDLKNNSFSSAQPDHPFIKLPAEISTKDLKSENYGKMGYLDEYNGPGLGTKAVPWTIKLKLKVEEKKANVFLVARDLTNVEMINHQFILVKINCEKTCKSLGVDYFKENDENGNVFFMFTLGGFPADGNNSPLIYEHNNNYDVQASREVINLAKYENGKNPNNDKENYNRGDNDPEINEIKVPAFFSGSNDFEKNLNFITKIIEAAKNFEHNNQSGKLHWYWHENNCVAWSYSLFVAIGVDKKTILKAQDFSGIDVGTADIIDIKYFQK